MMEIVYKAFDAYICYVDTCIWIFKHGRPGGYHIWWLLGEHKWLFLLFLLKIHTNIHFDTNLIEIGHTRHMCQLRRLSWPHLALNLYFEELTFSTQIKSIESSRNMTLHSQHYAWSNILILWWAMLLVILDIYKNVVCQNVI